MFWCTFMIAQNNAIRGITKNPAIRANKDITDDLSFQGGKNQTLYAKGTKFPSRTVQPGN